MRDRLLIAAMALLFWSICGWIDYGLFTKRNNDFCLMWSRDSWGNVSNDWCAKWRIPDNIAASVMSVAGPISLPAGLAFASSDGPLALEFFHIENAYRGRRAER